MLRGIISGMDATHTHKVRTSAIAAIGRNRELGKHGDLIWRIPDDLKRVKALTTGHTIIMGRKTYESIGRALPNRTNIVVSSNPDFAAHDCIVVTSLDAALEHAQKIEGEKEDGEIFIFGGASIYEAAMPTTDRLYLTVIDATDPEADTFFPDYSAFSKVTEKEKRGPLGDLEFEWLTLERK